MLQSIQITLKDPHYYIFANSITSHLLQEFPEFDSQLALYLGYSSALVYLDGITDYEADVGLMSMEINNALDVQNRLFKAPIPNNLIRWVGANLTPLHNLAYREDG